jgi:hypothetical protein
MYAPDKSSLLAQASPTSKPFHVLFVDINRTDGFFKGSEEEVLIGKPTHPFDQYFKLLVYCVFLEVMQILRIP